MHKRWWTGFAAAALAAAGGVVWGATGLAGAEAPDFALKSVQGENLRLSEFRGEIVMLTFWAGWCGDCRTQLRELGRMEADYRAAGVNLLAVSLDQSARQARQAAAELGIAVPVLHDAGGEVGRMYAVERLPSMVVIVRSGIVRDVFEGYARGHERQYLERVQALLRE